MAVEKDWTDGALEEMLAQDLAVTMQEMDDYLLMTAAKEETDAGNVYRCGEGGTHFQIFPKDAFWLYMRNDAFRAAVDTGAYRYVEDRFVIDSPQYIRQDEQNQARLTDEARAHPEGCMLRFSIREVYLPGGSGDLDAYRGMICCIPSYNERSTLSCFEPQENLEVLDHAMQGYKEAFDKQYALNSKLYPTFSERICQVMEATKVNKTVFMQRTGLNEMVYSRLINHPELTPDLHTTVSICAGLSLNAALARELLTLAGHALNNSLEHQLYSFLLTMMQNCDLAEKNAFLQCYGVKPLGSQQRK